MEVVWVLVVTGSPGSICLCSHVSGSNWAEGLLTSDCLVKEHQRRCLWLVYFISIAGRSFKLLQILFFNICKWLKAKISASEGLTASSELSSRKYEALMKWIRQIQWLNILQLLKQTWGKKTWYKLTSKQFDSTRVLAVEVQVLQRWQQDDGWSRCSVSDSDPDEFTAGQFCCFCVSAVESVQMLKLLVNQHRLWDKYMQLTGGWSSGKSHSILHSADLQLQVRFLSQLISLLRLEAEQTPEREMEASLQGDMNIVFDERVWQKDRINLSI